MIRNRFALVVGLLVCAVTTSVAQAGKKLYVGNLPYSATERIVVEDSSTSPATPVHGIGMTLDSAREGTMGESGPPIIRGSALGIVNPGADGRGDAAFLTVSYTGPAGAFPTSSTFATSIDIANPTTGEPQDMKSGTVKFFNESKGFGFVIYTDPTGIPEELYSISARIDLSHTGLSFSHVEVVRPAANSFFDVFVELSLEPSGVLNAGAPLFELTIAPVPEPTGPLALVAIGATMAGRRRRRISRCAIV